MANARLAMLLDTIRQVGRVHWIGLNPARRQPMVSVREMEFAPDVVRISSAVV